MLLDSFLEYRVGSCVGLKREGSLGGKKSKVGSLTGERGHLCCRPWISTHLSCALQQELALEMSSNFEEGKEKKGWQITRARGFL